MRNLLILVSLTLAIAATAYASSTTGDWMCSSGACTLGATTALSTQVIGGAESLSIGASNDTFLFTVDSTDTVTLIGADAAGATNLTLDTTGAGAITIGSADVTGFTSTTVGASLNLQSTTADTLTLTAAGTNPAVFAGADAAGIATTKFDTTGAGAIIVGSGDVLQVTMTSDGGSVVIDGYVQGDVGPFIALDSGALTANNTHLAGAAGDYVMPACETANIGEWVTVIVKDVSEVVVLQPASGDTLKPAGAVIEADHEMDSSGAATGDGDFVTFVCVVADSWYSTAIGGAWIDGGAS